MRRFILLGSVSTALIAAIASVGCNNASGQAPSQSNEPRVLKLFAGTWQMQLADDEKREFKEQKIEIPTVVLRENGTWTWRFIDETREGSIKTEDGALLLVWEKVNGKAPEKDLEGETRATLTASEPAELLVRCGQEDAEYMFDRVPAGDLGSAEGSVSKGSP